MGNFLTKVKNWLIAHKPTKRRLIQVYAALLYNANIKGFVSGNIYTGDTKKLCVPGLNCYSCPGAIGACPLGALQDSLANSGKTAPAYIFGILILFGLLLGRMICGFLCPFGLIQELLYKIRTPKLRKSRFTRIASYFKYILLIVVIAIPIIYSGIPVFCKYICPAGTLEGAVSLLANAENSGFYAMLGYLFSWKFCVLVAVVAASVFIYRFLCRFICPLGAIYSLFCKISLLGVKLDKDKCINCGLCIQGCKMDIKHVGDHECIQCGECISVCPVQAISWKGSRIFVRNTTPLAQPAVAEGEKINLLTISRASAAQTLSAQSGTAVAAEILPVNAFAPQENAEIAALNVDGGASATQLSEAAEAENGEQTGETPAPTEKPLKKRGAHFAKIKAAFKKPRFVAEFAAWTAALAVLICALVFYNLPEQKKIIPDFVFSTYSADGTLSDEVYSTATQEKRVKVLYFWRTELTETHDGVEVLLEYAQKAPSAHVAVDVVAVHSIYKDDRDVGAFIAAKGWFDGISDNFVFAQDDISSNAYSFFGGDISVPVPVLAVVAPDGKIISLSEESFTAEELETAVLKAQSAVVYAEGDLCPQFTLGIYNAQEGATVSMYDDYVGKVTVINFWYTNCDPCKEELPFYDKIYEEMRDEINMVAIHSYSAVPPGGVQEWLDSNCDGDGKRWNSYSLTFAQDEEALNVYAMLGGRTAFPMTVIVNARGVITKVIQGSCKEETLRAAIAEAKG